MDRKLNSIQVDEPGLRELPTNFNFRTSFKDHGLEQVAGYEQELKLLGHDLLKLRHYDRYHLRGKENRSPDIERALATKDWYLVIEEMRKDFLSIGDMRSLVDTLYEEVTTGDPCEANYFFHLLRLAAVFNNPGGSGYAVPDFNGYLGNKKKLILQEVIHGAGESEEVVRRVRELLDEVRDTFSGDFIDVSQNYQDLVKYFKNSRLNLRNQLKVLAMEKFPEDLKKEFGRAIRWYQTQIHDEGVSDKTQFASQRLVGLELKDLNTDDKQILIEQVRDEVMENLNKGIAQDPSLRVLAVLDPEQALIECEADPDRRQIVLQQMSNEPETLRFLRERDVVSETEIFMMLVRMVDTQPRLVGCLVRSIELPALMKNALVTRVIDNSDLITGLLMFEVDQSSSESHCAPQEMIERAEVTLMGSDNNYIRIIQALELNRIGLLSVKGEEMVRQAFAEEVNRVSGELSTEYPLLTEEKLNELASNSWKNLSRQNDNFDFSELTTMYPESVRGVLSAMSLLDRLNGPMRKFFVDENYYWSLSRYREDETPELLKKFAADTIFEKWGVNAEAIDLANTMGLMPYISESVFGDVINFLGKQIESYDQGEIVGDAAEDLLLGLAELVCDKRIEQDAGLMQRIKELAIRSDDFFKSLLETTYPYETGLKQLLTDEELEKMMCNRLDVASKLKLMMSLSSLSEYRGEELFENLYARIVQDHSGEMILQYFADFQKAVQIFGNFVESKQDRESVMSLMLDLRKDEVDCIGNRGNLREGSIANKVCHLRIAKLLQAQGISVEDSIAWVQRTCNKETDPQFDDTLSHVDRTKFSQFDQAVRQNLDVVRLMAVYPQLDWEKGAPRIVDDVIGNTSEAHRGFIASLLTELGVSGERQEKVIALFLLKDLRQGKLSRRVVSCGLLRLAGDDGSRETLEKVIDALELTKDDGRRLRTIFRLRDYVDIQSMIGTADYTGLHELRAKIVAEAAEKFAQEFEFVDLSTEFDLNIENLVSTGLLGIYASLQRSYEGKVNPASLTALKEVYRHIVLQDFHEWRYTQPATEQQFGDLSKDERNGWIQLAEPVMVASQSDSGTMLIESLTPILRDVRSHLSFNHSKWELKIRENKKNGSATDRLRLKEEREMKVVVALRDVSEYDLNRLPKEGLLARCRELKQRLSDLGEIQSARDMKEAIRLLVKNESQVQCLYTASETDDPVQLLNSGVFPRETCQSWRGGIYNECLISTVADGNKKLINVVIDEGGVVGRAIIKVMQLQDNNNIAYNVIVVEPIYTLRANSAINMAVMQLVVQKAKMMGGMPIVVDNIHTMPAYIGRLIQDERMNARNQVYSLKSVNPTGEFEYSDLFVGRLSRGEMSSKKRKLTVLRFDKQAR